MTESTPLQELDDAVRAFVATFDTDAVLSGWTISYQTSYLQTDDPTLEPLTWDASYAVSPGLSPFAAIGLAQHAARAIGDIYRDIHDAEEGDNQ